MGLFHKKKNNVQLKMLCDGVVEDIENACDEVFSQKMMGDGVMIIPKDGNIYAPCEAVVSMVFPTKHAIGLQLEQGIEILLHFGVDTVNLNGEGFQLFVKEGDHVAYGDKIWETDLSFIRERVPSEAIMVIISANPAAIPFNKHLGDMQKGNVFMELETSK